MNRRIIHDKNHLLGIFIDFSANIIAYYPNTFLEIINYLHKSNQSVDGMKRFFSNHFPFYNGLLLDPNQKYVNFENLQVLSLE